MIASRKNPDMTERCSGGTVTMGAFKQPFSQGWWKANCPTCGRWVAFHWGTGKFKTHNRLIESVDDNFAPPS